MNIEQFTERLCSTYRLPRNKGNDYLHINVNLDPTPFVLLRRLSSKNSNPNDRAAYRLDVSVSTFYFDLKPEWVGHIIREWFPLIITHIEDLGNHLYKATYIKQGRGYQLNLATTYVFYDGVRIAASDNLQTLKDKYIIPVKVGRAFFKEKNCYDILELFGDCLITPKLAQKAGLCVEGIEEFMYKHNLWDKQSMTLNQLVPLLTEHDIDGWYNLRKLAYAAWLNSKKRK